MGVGDPDNRVLNRSKVSRKAIPVNMLMERTPDMVVRRGRIDVLEDVQGAVPAVLAVINSAALAP